MGTRTLLMFFLLLPAALLNGQSRPNARITGQVIRILDGDTFELLTDDKKTVKIRMNGIDAPEKNQAFGQKSKDYLGSLCFRRQVAVVYTGKDRYNRVLGTAYNTAGQNINLKMVEAGMAWHFVRYSSDGQLAAAQRYAREQRKGLWSDPGAIAPWEFRRSRTRR